MADDSLGLGINDPAYLELVKKQQEALVRANQPYGMDAGQGAIAAGLGLLPALVGGLVKGKEGLNIGLQAGLGGVNMYDKTLQSNFERASENEKANAALYGAQANQVLQNDLGLKRFLQQEGVRQQNRISLKGIPQVTLNGGGSGASDDIVDASMAAALEKTTGIPADQLIGKSLDYVDRLQRNEQIATGKKSQQVTASGEERRQEQREMEKAKGFIPGLILGKNEITGEYIEVDPVVKRDVQNTYSKGTELLKSMQELKDIYKTKGQTVFTKKGEVSVDAILSNIIRIAKDFDNYGAALQGSELELARYVNDWRNVGISTAIAQGVRGAGPLAQLPTTMRQLSSRIKSRLAVAGYSIPAPVSRSRSVSPSAFEQLKKESESGR